MSPAIPHIWEIRRYLLWQIITQPRKYRRVYVDRLRRVNEIERLALAARRKASQ